MKSKAKILDRPKEQLHDGERDVPDELAPKDVLVRVWYCGICHTDMHEMDNDWHREDSFYPFIPGHEVIGEVTKVGAEVTGLKPGDVVGVGWQRDACGVCAACQHGWRNACVNIKPTYEDMNGGFQQYIACNEAFALLIPKELQKPEAAPLLCGGITVYSPLVVQDVKPGDKALVIGLGGLGHFAVQFLAKRGNDVSVLTRSGAKRLDAEKFGAKTFYTSLDEVPDRAFDFIMITAPSEMDLTTILAKVAPRGNVCVVGAVPGKLSFEAFDLINPEATISAGSIGDPVTIADMLDFAAKNGIEAVSEIYTPDRIGEAFQRLRDGQVRYRAVVDFRNY